MLKTINLEGDVGWEITAASLREQLPEDNSDVVLNISSYGGSIFEGMDLYNTIKDYPGKITAKIGSIGASAASFFPLSADKVVARSNSTMMMHKGWSFAVGNADEMRKEADILEGLDGLIAGIYAEKTGKEKSTVLQDMKEETWLMGWESIVDYGLADEVEEGDMSIVEKTEAVAKIETLKNKMRDSGMFEKDIERATAWIKPVNNSVVDGKNKIEEGNMDKMMSFEDYLKSNPEAEARHKSLVDEAVANAKSEEGKRVNRILALAHVNLTEEAKAAIENGQTPGEYAEAVLENNAEKVIVDNSKKINIPKAPNASEEAETVYASEQKKALDFWDKAYEKEDNK